MMDPCVYNTRRVILLIWVTSDALVCWQSMQVKLNKTKILYISATVFRRNFPFTCPCILTLNDDVIVAGIFMPMSLHNNADY